MYNTYTLNTIKIDERKVKDVKNKCITFISHVNYCQDFTLPELMLSSMQSQTKFQQVFNRNWPPDSNTYM